MTRIAVLGLGEAGGAIARDLVAAGADVRGYDPPDGVDPRSDEADAVRDAELAGFDERTIDRLVVGTHKHARRRADEMTAAAEQLTELGVRPLSAAAARDLLIGLRDREAPACG